MSGKAHRFKAVDRGQGHIHRYTPTCKCGWFGRHKRTIAEAKDYWHEGHAGPIAKPDKRGRWTPAKPTPTADLPEALR